MPKSKLDEKSLQIIVDEIRLKLDDQLDSVKSLDNKAGIIVSFSGVILTILLTSDTLNKGSRYAAVSAIFVFIASLLSLTVLLVRSYKRDPHPRNFYTRYAKKKHIETLEVLAGSFITSFEKNEKKVTIKKWLINFAFVSLGAAGLLLVIKLVKMSNIL